MLLVAYHKFNLSLFWFFYLFMFYLIICFLGAAFIRSNLYLNVICRYKGNNSKTIFLTFDDGPDEKETPLVLDILEKHNVKASFFIIGEKAEMNSSLLRHIASRGHVLGNHSYSHHNLFPLKRKRKIEQELNKTFELIKNVNPNEEHFFRPPFGFTNPIIAGAVNTIKPHVIGWSFRSLDTMIKDKDKLYKRLVRKTSPGKVVLLHDTVKDIHIVLDKYIVYLKKNNYNFETVNKLISVCP